MTETKKKVGRPRKTLSDYLPDNWQQIIFEMSAEGCSDVEIRAHFIWNGSTKTFHNEIWDALIEREEEFSVTIKKAKILCEAWWQKQGRDSLKHPKDVVFETALWFINMKNRFGWVDKSDVSHTIDIETKDTLAKYGTIDIQTFRERFRSVVGQSN